MPKVTRRRFMQVVAGAGLWTQSMGIGGAVAGMLQPVGHSARVHRWHGRLLGADTELTLSGVNEADAEQLFEACRIEAVRLERLFSLYVPDSIISCLNSDGGVAAPPADFEFVVQAALDLAAATKGAFDPTVQPLWQLYATHFRNSGTTQGPGVEAIERALRLVDYRALAQRPGWLGFSRPGMALTLNGIAQGYITDRITGLLQARGLAHVLVNMGEYRALGHHPANRPWQVAIRDPSRIVNMVTSVALSDRALATSAGYGTVFDAKGRHHHLFDPATGLSAARYASVSVSHPSAMIADGLSTAFSAMPLERIRKVAGDFGAVHAWVIHPDGALTEVVS